MSVKMPVMRILSMAGLLLLPALARAQEVDKIFFRRSDKPMEGEITSLSCKAVSIKLAAAGPQAQAQDRDGIVSVEPDKSSFNSTYRSGMRELGKGEFAAAAGHFQNTVKGAKANGLDFEFAYWKLAECHEAAGNTAGWAKTLMEFKTASPNSYYLFDIYQALIDAHLRSKQPAEADKLVKELRQHATEHQHKGWDAAAAVMGARVLHGQGKFKEALAAVKAHAKDERVGQEAQLLELRCLVDGQDLSGAKARAGDIVKGKESPRLMTAAYNALGDAERGAGKHREAMMHYLRGVAHYNAGGSPELEYSMAYSAISMAEAGKASTDKETKQKLLGRAQGMLGRLVGTYGASDLSRKVEDALK